MRDLAVGDRGEADEAADLDVIGADGVARAVQRAGRLRWCRCWCRCPRSAAPIATSARARSCTCGSQAALRRTVRPLAATAAMSAFSVPVTLGSSRKMSAPVEPLRPRARSGRRRMTEAPSCSSARKWVSTRRRPMTSPPGGGRVTEPKRASSGPASRIEARIRAQSPGSSGLGRTLRGCPRGPRWGRSTRPTAPRSTSSASMVSTSRMRGMLSSSIGPSARTVLARIGSAAFLLPAGRMVPRNGRPPRTRKRGGMAKADGVGESRQADRGGCDASADPVVLPGGVPSPALARRPAGPFGEDTVAAHTLALLQVAAPPGVGGADHGHLAGDHRPLRSSAWRWPLGDRRAPARRPR